MNVALDNIAYQADTFRFSFPRFLRGFTLSRVVERTVREDDAKLYSFAGIRIVEETLIMQKFELKILLLIALHSYYDYCFRYLIEMFISVTLLITTKWCGKRIIMSSVWWTVPWFYLPSLPGTGFCRFSTKFTTPRLYAPVALFWKSLRVRICLCAGIIIS